MYNTTGYNRKLDTDREPIVKSILQRANSEQVSSINKVQAEAVFGPTVYVMVDLDGQKHKALVDTGSNVNILSEKTYSTNSVPNSDHSEYKLFRQSMILSKYLAFSLAKKRSTPGLK